jgi:3',5'-cyclic-AMP phosphodiesterase
MKTRLFFILTILLTGCQGLFEYSPFQVNLDDSEMGNTQINLDMIESDSTKSIDFVRIAVIADIHIYMDELTKCVSLINKNEDIDFVVVCGDLADSGLEKEFSMALERLKKLKYPYFTVIGNHDYLGNGRAVYENMFGPRNYSFSYGRYNFVVFDNVVWENHNNKPDFDWLKSTLNSFGPNSDNIVFAHIPAYADQLVGKYDKLYNDIMVENNVRLSVHGHEHRFGYQKVYNPGPDYLQVDGMMKKVLTIVTITPTNINVDKVNF